MSELPEKVIMSSGCHDCPFNNDKDWCALDSDIDIDGNVITKTRNHECPLLTHTIRVVKND